MFGRKARKNHVLWVFGPKAGNTRSRRSLAEIFRSNDARRRRAHGRHMLARQDKAQATIRAFARLRAIRAELAEGRRVKIQRDRATNAVLALVGTALITILSLPGALTGIPTQGWSGIEAYSPSSQPRSATMRVILPAVPRRRVRSGAMDAIWVGANGDPDYGGVVGEWLPQAGWYVTPGGDGQWSISPWAIVCHTVGRYAQYPGYYAGWEDYVPAGTTLTATMTFTRKGIVATLTASNGLVIAKRLPQLPGETSQFPLIEGIVEAPGAGEVTDNMALQRDGNVPLIPTGRILMNLNVQYAGAVNGQPAIHPMAIDQPGNWANATTITGYRARQSSVTVAATIIGRRADGIGDWMLGAVYWGDNLLASVL